MVSEMNQSQDTYCVIPLTRGTWRRRIADTAWEGRCRGLGAVVPWGRLSVLQGEEALVAPHTMTWLGDAFCSILTILFWCAFNYL